MFLGKMEKSITYARKGVMLIIKHFTVYQQFLEDESILL